LILDNLLAEGKVKSMIVIVIVAMAGPYSPFPLYSIDGFPGSAGVAQKLISF
jgi:hypothetical protein